MCGDILAQQGPQLSILEKFSLLLAASYNL